MAQGLKDREKQTYYEELLSMYASSGWKFHAEDLMRLRGAADTLNGIKTMDDLNFRLGQLHIIDTMLAQPGVVQSTYDALLEDEDAPIRV